MENIVKLQSCIKEFISKELAEFYTFEVWKDTLILLRQSNNNAEAHTVFNRYGDAFQVRKLFVDVQASEDRWAPTVSIEYEWKTQQSTIGIRIIIVKAEVQYVQISDMLSASTKFGSEHDFVKEFDKTVVMMKSLRG